MTLKYSLLLSTLGVMIQFIMLIVSIWYSKRQMSILLRSLEKPKVVQIVRWVLSPLIDHLLSTYINSPLWRFHSILDLTLYVRTVIKSIRPGVLNPSDIPSPDVVVEEFKVLAERYSCWKYISRNIVCLNNIIEDFEELKKALKAKLKDILEKDPEIPKSTARYKSMPEILADDFLSQVNQPFLTGPWRDIGYGKFLEVEDRVKEDLDKLIGLKDKIKNEASKLRNLLICFRKRLAEIYGLTPTELSPIGAIRS